MIESRLRVWLTLVTAKVSGWDGLRAGGGVGVTVTLGVGEDGKILEKARSLRLPKPEAIPSNKLSRPPKIERARIVWLLIILAGREVINVFPK